MKESAMMYVHPRTPPSPTSHSFSAETTYSCILNSITVVPVYWQAKGGRRGSNATDPLKPMGPPAAGPADISIDVTRYVTEGIISLILLLLSGRT